jgi:predicted DNA-binding protein with PD1-like motif
MQAKLLDNGDEKTFALIFKSGDEVIKGLTEFARRHSIVAAHFSAIGALQSAVLGYFDRERKEYLKIPFEEQVEVLSLLGDVALKGDEPKIHAHVVVGKRDGTAHGGHIIEATVWPTLEVILTESPRHLRRKHDEESGLALIDLGAATQAST